ncbi:ABC transporter ATP-binding protein [Methanospirillum sp.]
MNPSRKYKPIIEVKHLSKEYAIGSDRSYKRLSESISNAVRNPLTSLKGLHEQKDTFWALKDINLEVERGEVLGIIGRNGAGKSTLLKVLARITHPTEGEVRLRGRVGSLLEVGTGFHPELTGRENIYFNGSILGMKKREINDKFDEIVKFAGIERHLDTPTKRYSSGMTVRLAFSVAAHLDPEILLVDEVLAVGDAEFQKKCLGKMSEVAEGGRTVLFVSHNMNAVESLCNSALILEKGEKVFDSDNVRETILKYSYNVSNSMEWTNLTNSFNNKYFVPKEIFFTDTNNEKINLPFSNNEDHYINIKGTVQTLDNALQVGYALFNESYELIYWSIFNDDKTENWPKINKGTNTLMGHIPKRFLNAGIYYVELIIALYYREWICQPKVNSPVLMFKIEGGLSESPYWMVRRPGIMAPLLNWSNKIED